MAEKWCPFARVVTVVTEYDVGDTTTVTTNRHQDGSPSVGTRCLREGCAVYVLAKDRGHGWCGLVNIPPLGSRVEPPVDA